MQLGVLQSVVQEVQVDNHVSTLSTHSKTLGFIVDSSKVSLKG